MTTEIVIPGTPSDPTHIELDFHGDGRMVVTRRTADGGQQRLEYVTATGLILGITANPGGVPSLDGTHDAGRATQQGAFFEMLIRREY